MMKKYKWSVSVTALICITLLAGLALYKGINGLLLTGVIGVLAGIAGFKLQKV